MNNSIDKSIKNAPLNWVQIMDEKEISQTVPGEMIPFEIDTDDGETISLIMMYTKGSTPEWVVFENFCPHDGGFLDDGNADLEKCTIECSRHGAIFDMRSGAVVKMPASSPIKVFPLKLENGNLLIGLTN